MSEILINVYLKPEILDPQGRAILGALARKSMYSLVDIRQGKQFQLKFLGELNPQILSEVHVLAGEFFSNPTIEDYSIEVKNES